MKLLDVIFSYNHMKYYYLKNAIESLQEFSN